MKFSNIIFFTSLIMSTLISISANSWFGMWIGLEVNLLSFIPLMNKSSMNSSESMMKYFIVQALASTILIFWIINFSTNFIIFNNYFMLMINSAILMKMGAAPFHFWFPELAEGLNWINNMILLTWQKITPMIMLFYNININSFMFLIIFLNLMISGIMGINQISLRKIMAFSSMNHMAWMISALLYSEQIWFMYFSIYMLNSILMLSFFSKLNIFYIQQLILTFNYNFLKIMFILLFFSMGGLPPFLGFFPKWLIIQNLMNFNQTLISIMLVILTLMTLFFYLQISFNLLILPLQKPSYLLNQHMNLNFFLNMTFLISLILFIFIPNF